MLFVSHGPLKSAGYLAAVGMFLAVTAFPTVLSAEDSSFVSVAKSYIDSAMKSLSDRFSGVENEPPKTPKETEEVARQAVLNGLMRAMFLEEKGRFFTQSKWGAKSVPYQMEGIQTIQLDEGSLNDGDRAAGIDQRITFEIKVREYRQFDETGGWGSWVKGNPPHLDSVTLVRQGGVWKVSVSPLWAYSLK